LVHQKLELLARSENTRPHQFRARAKSTCLLSQTLQPALRKVFSRVDLKLSRQTFRRRGSVADERSAFRRRRARCQFPGAARTPRTPLQRRGGLLDSFLGIASYDRVDHETAFDKFVLDK
jgi:hypothetical protein